MGFIDEKRIAIWGWVSGLSFYIHLSGNNPVM